jgi:hypothetical protein
MTRETPEPLTPERETAVTLLAIHLHRKGVGCDAHRGDDRAVADVMHRDDAYDIYDFIAALRAATPDPAEPNPVEKSTDSAPAEPGLRETLARIRRAYERGATRDDLVMLVDAALSDTTEGQS